MARINLQVLQGADRGKTYANLQTPITIGREEGNSVQLNDERISRFHVKIQEDNDHLVLTDLDSTNGTQVNGQECQLRVLRVGDLIAVGRSVLLVGDSDEIADRIESLTSEVPDPPATGEADFELATSAGSAAQQIRNPKRSFEIPQRLSPAQAAQLVELLEDVSERLTTIARAAGFKEDGHSVELRFAEWQMMLDLNSKVARLARRISDPEAEGE
jgi:pSer/pThr/pTyr-binding forkhead associated (FHA) protein